MQVDMLVMFVCEWYSAITFGGLQISSRTYRHCPLNSVKISLGYSNRAYTIWIVTTSWGCVIVTINKMVLYIVFITVTSDVA